MPHAGIYQLYRDLLALRRQHPAFRNRSQEHYTITTLGNSTIALQYTSAEPTENLLILISLSGEVELNLMKQPITLPPDGRVWLTNLDSEDTQYGGSGTISLGEAIQLNGARALVLTHSHP